MAIRQNTAEGGSNGTTITPSNTGAGSGTGFNATANGTTAATFTSATAAQGSLAYSATAASGATVITQWTGLSGTQISTRISFQIPSNPAATTEIIQLRTAAAAVVRLLITNSGRLQVNDASNTLWKLATNPLSVGTWYDVVLRVAPGTSTTDGTLQWGYYATSAPSTLIEGVTETTANAGTNTALTEMRWGKLGASTATNAFYFDSIIVNDNPAGTVPGPINGGTPTLSQTASVQYIVDARASAPGASGALSYTATRISGPTLTYSQIATGYFAFTQDVSTSSVYTISVNEAGGGSANADITIPIAGQADVTGQAEILYFDGTTLS